MPKTRNYQRSFAGGEISPEMYGRVDDPKYQNGAATARNFMITPTGTAKNRAGFAYVRSTADNGIARLIPFVYSIDQSMAIEMGDQYLRFHTQGETLVYSTDVDPWVPLSGDISLSYTTPSVVSWPAHGLANGDPVRFYLYGAHTPAELPVGFKVGYTYTVQLIDADSFNILDGGKPVALTGSVVGGPVTNYPGTGTAGDSVNLTPNQSVTNFSAILGGLAALPVTGGQAILNVQISTAIYQSSGYAQVIYRYMNDSSTWQGFHTSTVTESMTVSVPIPLADLSHLHIQIMIIAATTAFGSVNASGNIASWSVDVPSGGGGTGPGALTIVRGYRYYNAGDIVSYSGIEGIPVDPEGVPELPTCYSAVRSDSGGVTVPGTDPTIWYGLPRDGTYQIPSPYAEADLFSIRYTQSADVMTLVHPLYPPQELRRLGPTSWSLTPIQFGPPLDTPTAVAVVATPGFKVRVSSISLANPAVITTTSNHTLTMGDPIYIEKLSSTSGVSAPVSHDGFYLVEKVPTDTSGNEIPNELIVMDYSGNVLDASGWTTYTPGATIQYGTQIFNITNSYAVQALAADGVTASALSTSVSVLNNLDVTGSYNTITWAAVDGSQSYNVYKQFNGLWGFIGNSQTLSFIDNNIAPDFSITPGYPDAVFTGPGNYPRCTCYFEQRRCFAGTLNAPQNLWMSNTGTESMFSYSLPSLATDRIAVRIVSLQADAIQQLVPMSQLIALTSTAEFAPPMNSQEAMTPSTVSFKAQSYIGAGEVMPSIINTSMVYAAARGGHVRELGYAWTVNGFSTGDLSLRAAHLFDGLSLIDQTYSKSPQPILWFTSSSGDLLGFTYIPEEQIGAWHHHDTQGAFESACCVPEGDEDVVYAVIRRFINGSTVRYIERQASRLFTTLTDAFFVDAGATFTSATPVTLISGLTWLEGCTVAVLADGSLQSQKVVTAGVITLDYPAKVVQVGLPYVADLNTLPAVLQLDGFGQGRMKNINRAWLKVFQSSSILIGPDEDHLTEVVQRTTEPYGSPPAAQSAELEVLTTPSWQASGQTFIRQINPLPLDVVGLTMEVVLGD